jgi:hypothetical protein
VFSGGAWVSVALDNRGSTHTTHILDPGLGQVRAAHVWADPGSTIDIDFFMCGERGFDVTVAGDVYP